MIITLLVFLAILGLLVFIHELGHFLSAKRNGVTVHEFAFGFRPRLWSKKIGETEYAINLIPLGGYVRMEGESDQDSVLPGSFRVKTVFQRFQIMIAGVVMNFLLGWLILIILFAVGFQPLFPGVAKDPFVRTTAVILITGVNAGSPAAGAGLQPGDQVISVNRQKAATAEEFISQVANTLDRPTTLVVKRDKELKTVTVTPRSHPPQDQGAIGVDLAATGSVKTPWYLAPLAGLYETVRITGLTVAGFGHFLATLIVHQRVSPDVTGIVGVGVLTGITRRLGLTYLAQLVMMITIGLGVINLVPILPLDGGHIVALAYEKIAGRPLSERQLGALTTIGIALVALLFVVVTYKDLVRFNVFGRL